MCGIGIYSRLLANCFFLKHDVGIWILKLYTMCIGIVNNGLEFLTLEVARALAFKLGAILGVGYILGACIAFFLGIMCRGMVGGFQCRTLPLQKVKPLRVRVQFL